MTRARMVPAAVAACVVALFPLAGVPESAVGSANLAAVYATVAVSLALLTGWVGQISLGHAALVGVGAYATGWITGGLGIPFPLSVPLAGLAGAVIAGALGVVALRVRGLYLAVATLVFSWMASEFLFRQEIVTRYDQIPDRPIGGGEGWWPSFDFTNRRVYYYVAWAVLGAIVLAAANLRDSKTGRAFFAVRGSEMAAASLGIDVMRTKLLAFAISGFVAGVAGNLLMSDARVVTADQFTFNWSLFYVGVAVVGGLGSLGGAVASGMVFAGLTEIFFRVRALGGFLELVSGLLLAATLLAYNGGLASIPERVRGLRRFLPLPLRDRAPERPHGEGGPSAGAPARVDAEGSPVHVEERERAEPAVAPVARLEDARPREERPALVEAEHVTVQFGGLTAVNDASLTVREGEIVGLIGPNGAGKTTLFNSIAGFNRPTSGRIRLYGRDVTALPVHRRASIGVARTFQAIQLFGQLSVYDNLLVATHVNNPTGFVRHALVTERAISHEQDARARVDEVLAQLDLEAVAGRRAADLPFGVLRMVEVARALVTGFRVMMLDEPASGLDNAETDRLTDILRRVRDLGVTQLLIEHDVRMVTSVVDYLYVLDQGRIIAHGPPADVARDPAVVAAYLGEPAGEQLEEAVV